MVLDPFKDSKLFTAPLHHGDGWCISLGNYMSQDSLIETLNCPFVTPCSIYFLSPKAGWAETPRDPKQLSWGWGNKQHSSGKQPSGSQLHRITASRPKHHRGGEDNSWSVCPCWVLEFSQSAWKPQPLTVRHTSEQTVFKDLVKMSHKAPVNHLKLTNNKTFLNPAINNIQANICHAFLPKYFECF